MIVAEIRAPGVVLATLADEHRVAVAPPVLHAVPVAAAELMRALGVLAVLTAAWVQVEVMVFGMKRHLDFGGVGPDSASEMGPEPGDLPSRVTRVRVRVRWAPNPETFFF